MNEYENEIAQVQGLLNSFIITNNLMELAKALFKIESILDKEEFPTQQYKEWLKK